MVELVHFLLAATDFLHHFNNGLRLVFNLHVEHAILLKDEELLEHSVEQGGALRERDIAWLSAEKLDSSDVRVDRHFLLILVKENLNVDLVFLEVQ